MNYIYCTEINKWIKGALLPTACMEHNGFRFKWNIHIQNLRWTILYMITHTQPFYGPFSGNSGLHDFMVQGKMNRGRLTIRLGATPSGLISDHLHETSIFYRPDALPAAQPTVSKHWRHSIHDQHAAIFCVVCSNKSVLSDWLLLLFIKASPGIHLSRKVIIQETSVNQVHRLKFKATLSNGCSLTKSIHDFVSIFE